MMQSREEARTLRQKLSYSKQKEERDPLMEYLTSFRERMAHAKMLLTDPEQTAFFFVTLPEALPIAVIRRFINWFHEFGIPVGGVIVNMRIDKDNIRDDVTDFVKNRVAMQDTYMGEIERTFDGLVRAVLPLFDDEVRGVAALAKAADLLLA
jgi:arsenite-transporting ATPase